MFTNFQPSQSVKPLVQIVAALRSLPKRRNRIKLFIKSKNFDEIKNGTFNIVGCTPAELKEHIEKQFSEGMNWGNYGLRGWHIDHIKPLSLAENNDDVYELCYYSNLQPMWAVENYKKGDRF